MDKLIMTENLKLKTRGLKGEHTPMPVSKSIVGNLNGLEKKARESISNVMLRNYKDLGRHGMTIDENKPMSEDFNMKLDKKVEESQEVFSSTTFAIYNDLGRYGMTIDK